MAQQARSQATRQKIIDAAVELFNSNGYAGTGLGDIIEHAGLTKGALYHHFESKEVLASAIINATSSAVLDALRGLADSPAPAMENLVHVSFVIADLVAGDPTVRTGSQLMRALSEFNEVALQTYSLLGAQVVALARQAGIEGDLREAVPPEAVGELFMSTFLGIELLSVAESGGRDMPGRLGRAWSVLLPAIADTDAVAYFQEFVDRETQRRR
ncbi:hypothetical protein BVC93_16490 [Mycobacterium sp. MS1601]|nr:hypothetical protein BVC93_16490 [Mycobacterium sp. MS1601]